MSSHRTLVVEPDETVLRSLVTALRIASLTVDAASSREAALTLMNRYRYDLVLGNLRMPGLDGPTLYQELIWRWPEGPPRIIFITESVFSAQHSRFFLEIGAPVLAKPIAPGDLWNTVEHELTRQYEMALRMRAAESGHLPSSPFSSPRHPPAKILPMTPPPISSKSPTKRSHTATSLAGRLRRVTRDLVQGWRGKPAGGVRNPLG